MGIFSRPVSLQSAESMLNMRRSLASIFGYFLDLVTVLENKQLSVWDLGLLELYGKNNN